MTGSLRSTTSLRLQFMDGSKASSQGGQNPATCGSSSHALFSGATSAQRRNALSSLCAQTPHPPLPPILQASGEHGLMQAIITKEDKLDPQNDSQSGREDRHLHN